MNLNVIDEETLQVSDDVHYEVTMLDTHHVIVVDNVLKIHNILREYCGEVAIEN